MQDPRAVPALVAVAVAFDDALVEELAMGALPAGWERRPPGPESQAMGRQWFDSRRSLALGLPSIIVPAERIVLLNPQHPEFASVRVGVPQPLSFDSRLR
ncbi:MAG: RES family NAD+ phosphorylase [Myxococcota bacterium]